MAKKTISDWAKKNFLHWFLESYQFQSSGPKQFLIQLAEDEAVLSKVHIVLDGSYLRPLLVISTEGTGMPPLLYKTHDDNTITDYMTILSQLQELEETPLYLTLYFPDRAANEPFQAVIEESMVPFDSAYANHILFQFELSLLNAAIHRDIEKNKLLAKIDLALDERNKRKFQRLVKKLNNL